MYLFCEGPPSKRCLREAASSADTENGAIEGAGGGLLLLLFSRVDLGVDARLPPLLRPLLSPAALAPPLPVPLRAENDPGLPRRHGWLDGAALPSDMVVAGHDSGEYEYVYIVN